MSSYPAYIGSAPVPSWLTTAMALQMDGTRRPKAAYRSFVEEGVDDELDRFYHKTHHAPILGDTVFEASVADHCRMNAESPDRVRRGHIPSFAEIVEITAAAFGVASESLLISRRGARTGESGSPGGAVLES